MTADNLRRNQNKYLYNSYRSAYKNDRSVVIRCSYLLGSGFTKS